MKKLINQPGQVVPELCHGLVLAHPSLSWDPVSQVISRRTPRSDKVVLISGGGSGHEPAHAGFVGTGMLDAAVCGDIFASPSQIQIYRAIRQAATPQGVLCVRRSWKTSL